MSSSKQLLHATLFLLVVLGLFLVQKSECLNASARVVTDLLPNEDEFMMESEISRRLLQAAGGGRTITPRAQFPDRTFCNRDVYGDCIRSSGRPTKMRPCNYANHCRSFTGGQ